MNSTLKAFSLFILFYFYAFPSFATTPCNGLFHFIQKNINPFSLLYQTEADKESPAPITQLMQLLTQNLSDFDTTELFWSWFSVHHPERVLASEAPFIKDTIEISLPFLKEEIANKSHPSPQTLSLFAANLSLSLANHSPAVYFKRSHGNHFYETAQNPLAPFPSAYELWCLKQSIYRSWLEWISEDLLHFKPLQSLRTLAHLLNTPQIPAPSHLEKMTNQAMSSIIPYQQSLIEIETQLSALHDEGRKLVLPIPSLSPTEKQENTAGFLSFSRFNLKKITNHYEQLNLQLTLSQKAKQDLLLQKTFELLNQIENQIADAKTLLTLNADRNIIEKNKQKLLQLLGP